ncbi:hypothetical protein GQ457_17G010040 [Hibiscus cannabinus]
MRISGKFSPVPPLSPLRSPPPPRCESHRRHQSIPLRPVSPAMPATRGTDESFSVESGPKLQRGNSFGFSPFRPPSDIRSSDLSHDLTEGSVGRRDRSPAQPSPARSTQPHEPVITGIVSFFLIYAGTCVLWTRVNTTIMDTVPGELYTEYGWRVVLL